MVFKSFGYYMKYALDLAEHMTATDIRKPHVGVVVASKDGEIVGEGYLKLIPGTRLIRHAERVALDESNYLAGEGTLFTTLEPCISIPKKRNAIFACCSELILERGIQRVVFGDYDTKFQGDGIRFLKNRGIEVIHLAMDFRNLGINYISNRLR